MRMSRYLPVITLDLHQRIPWRLSLANSLNKCSRRDVSVSRSLNHGEIIMLICFPVMGNHDPNWLTCMRGEILDITHEEPRDQPYICNGGEFKGSDSMN